jgi:hypothetical protein
MNFKILKFRLCLSDCILKQSLDIIDNNSIFELYPEFIASLKFVVEYDAKKIDPLNAQSYPYCKKLIAHSRMKLFMNIYAEIIYQIDTDFQFELSIEIKNAINEVTKELSVIGKPAAQTL